MLLLFVLQRLCAAAGVYMPPPGEGNEAWEQRCLDDLDDVLDELERP